MHYHPNLEHLQKSPNIIPYPHKTIILGEICYFFFSNSPQYLSFFCGHQYFPHFLSKKCRDTTPSISWDHPNNHFSVNFMLHLCGTHH